MAVAPFSVVLTQQGLVLNRGQTTTLQVNVGKLCNQACRHCHLEAGPECLEVMDPVTAADVVAFSRRGGFQVMDITGGAPEMNPVIDDLIKGVASDVRTVMIRSNLTALMGPRRDSLLDLFKKYRVVVVASLPALNAAQTESMRGKGIWSKSLETLRELNTLGYGLPGTGLELHLVANPVGAFLPTPQFQMEKRFRIELGRKFKIQFNHLYTFANVPLGRFRRWLMESGNLESYMQKLSAAFNPETLMGLMCRSLVSVSWDGFLYDCDFNLASALFMGGRKTHVSEMEGLPAPGAPIATADHCYACTAGSGFT